MPPLETRTDSPGETPEVPQDPCIMASGPITSWQIDGEAIETVTDFILGGSKMIQSLGKLLGSFLKAMCAFIF